MEKIRVLIVAGSMDVGGVENQLMHLLRNADKEKFQIDFTSTMHDAFYRKEIESLGGRFILIPEMSWRKPWKYCGTLYRIMKEGRYDIVHSHELFHSGITLLIAKLAGVKGRIAHAHSTSDGDGISAKRSTIRKIYNNIMRFFILKCSTVQVACSSLAGAFLYGKSVSKRKTYHVIYNSIDTKRYIENYDKAEVGEFCESDWKNILHVGRVYPVKNQKFLVDIAEELKNRDKKVRILCAGNAYDEEYMRQIENEICDRQLQDYIKMLGTRKDIDVLLRKSELFLLPSVYEGMPLVLIEAQAAGVPCVVANTFSKEVDFDINLVTWIEPAEPAETWADAIEKSMDMGRVSKELVVKAIAKNGFDSRIFASKICELYLKAN